MRDFRRLAVWKHAHAMGSANELEYHLLLARDLRYFTPEAYKNAQLKVDELKRTLSGFLARVRRDQLLARMAAPKARSSKLEARSQDRDAP